MDDTYFDISYVGMISPFLNRFKEVSHQPYKARFRCPFCGDSQKSESKTRGWLQESRTRQGLRFYCFNCFKPTGFHGLLKHVNPAIANSYVADKFGKKTPSKPKADDNSPLIKTVTVFNRKKPLDYVGLKRLIDLEDGHPAKEYIINRKIPEISDLYYAPKFANFVNRIVPGKLKEPMNKPRIVIPFLDSEGKLFGFTGRAILPDDDLRYVTIMLDDSAKKFFGFHRIDQEKRFWLFEGALDALFVPNAGALAGADGDYSFLEHPENAVLVFDNEPRNPEIHQMIKKAISAGLSIVVWPESISAKDLNSMVLDGEVTLEEINPLLNSLVYSGLEAELKLGSWTVSEKQNQRKRPVNSVTSTQGLGLSGMLGAIKKK